MRPHLPSVCGPPLRRAGWRQRVESPDRLSGRHSGLAAQAETSSGGSRLTSLSRGMARPRGCADPVRRRLRRRREQRGERRANGHDRLHRQPLGLRRDLGDGFGRPRPGSAHGSRPGRDRRKRRHESGWSPDGLLLAYASSGDAVAEDQRDVEIYVMRADGSGKRRLTNDPVHDATPAWSPDGKRIAFAHTPGWVPRRRAV